MAPSERLAPVTYLFGTQPSVASPAASEGLDSVELAPNHPVFRDESTLESMRGALHKLTAEQALRDAAPGAGSAESAGGRGRSTRDRRERARFERVSNVSMHALARRGMSSREMRDYLTGREFEEAVIDEEIDRLEGAGLLDDESLAETLVRTLRDRKGLGRAALTAELRRRHVDDDAIDEAMGGLDDDDIDRATALAVARVPQLRSFDSVTAKRRLGAFLMRRGYSSSVVSVAVQRALVPSGPRFD